MNQKGKYFFTAVILILSAGVAAAQSVSSPSVPWVSDRGYWVLKSNVYDPLHHTIFFYNNENKLVYSENLSGVKLDPDKRKTKIKLKKVLETTLTFIEQHKKAETISAAVSAILK